MNIEFRKLQPKESHCYRELRLECLKNHPENFGSNYEDELKKNQLFFQPFIESSHKDNFVMGGFNAEKLIAISGFHRFDTEKTKHRGRIIQVYVTKKYQGNHIGSHILKSTLNEAFNTKEIEQIELGVVTANKGAERMYKQIGFETYALQKNYLKIGSRYFDHKMMVIYAAQYNPDQN